MELWAAIDLLGGEVVTLRQGKESERTSWGEGPAEFASRWEAEGADGLHLVDLDAAFGKGSNLGTIRSIVERAKVPVEVGGGVRSRGAAEELLESGVARVIVGTIAYSQPETLRGLLEAEGPERVVVAADYGPDGRVVTKGWTSSQEFTVFEAAKRLEKAGVVNLLVTAVGKDGMGEGPDVPTLRRLASSTKKVRLVASGGIRDSADLKDLAEAGAAGAVIGKALYDGRVKLKEAKRRLGRRNP